MIVFWQALRTTVGWITLIFATASLGNWLGIWIGMGETPELLVMLYGLGAWCLGWLLFPRILIAFAVTVLALYLPLKAERVWLYLAAPLVNLLVWTAVTASVF
jgi:hypothetical protein